MTREGGLSVCDAVGGRERVEAADDVRHHVHNHESGKPLERKAMSAGTQALLDGANGALDFSDVAVSGDYVEVNGVECTMEALKVTVCMDINNRKTAAGVHRRPRRGWWQIYGWAPSGRYGNVNREKWCGGKYVPG